MIKTILIWVVAAFVGFWIGKFIAWVGDAWEKRKARQVPPFYEFDFVIRDRDGDVVDSGTVRAMPVESGYPLAAPPRDDGPIDWNQQLKDLPRKEGPKND